MKKQLTNFLALAVMGLCLPVLSGYGIAALVGVRPSSTYAEVQAVPDSATEAPAEQSAARPSVVRTRGAAKRVEALAEGVVLTGEGAGQAVADESEVLVVRDLVASGDLSEIDVTRAIDEGGEIAISYGNGSVTQARSGGGGGGSSSADSGGGASSGTAVASSASPNTGSENPSLAPDLVGAGAIETVVSTNGSGRIDVGPDIGGDADSGEGPVFGSGDGGGSIDPSVDPDVESSDDSKDGGEIRDEPVGKDGGGVENPGAGDGSLDDGVNGEGGVEDPDPGDDSLDQDVEGEGDPVQDENNTDTDAGGRREVSGGLRVHSWDLAPLSTRDIITPALLLRGNETPAVAVSSMIRHWGRGDKQGCVMFAPYVEVVEGAYEEVGLPTILRGEMAIPEIQAYWEAIFRLAAAEGVSVQRIALDWELGANYWQLGDRVWWDRTKELADAWGDEGVLARMPEDLKGMNGPDMYYRTHRSEVISFNQFELRMKSEMLVSHFMDSIVNTYPEMRYSNFNDYRSEDEVLDSNGWPWIQGGMGGTASPSLYSRDADYNLMLVEQALAVEGQVVVPWLPYPSFCGLEAWQETVEGCYRLGIREFLYWNPAKRVAEGDDKYAASVFRRLRQVGLALFD